VIGFRKIRVVAHGLLAGCLIKAWRPIKFQRTPNPISSIARANSLGAPPAGSAGTQVFRGRSFFHLRFQKARASRAREAIIAN
jgi:hypothetical protein